jgi:hypothetical protein
VPRNLKQQQIMTTNQSSEDYINDYVMYKDGFFVHGKVQFIKVQNQNNLIVNSKENKEVKIISKNKNVLENDKFYYAFGFISLSYFLIRFIF